MNRNVFDFVGGVRRPYAAAAACIGWIALALQLWIMIYTAPSAAAAGLAVVAYFSFFTILTNFLVALICTFAAVRANPSGFLANGKVQAAALVYILIVGATYSLLLRHLWEPRGAWKLADSLLHDVTPIVYLIYWILFAPKATLRFKDSITWLAPPFAYLGYILLRGALFGVYPYPFLDVSVLGYGRMLANVVVFVFVFAGLGLAVVGIARSLALRGRKAVGSSRWTLSNRSSWWS